MKRILGCRATLTNGTTPNRPTAARIGIAIRQPFTTKLILTLATLARPWSTWRRSLSMPSIDMQGAVHPIHPAGTTGACGSTSELAGSPCVSDRNVRPGLRRQRNVRPLPDQLLLLRRLQRPRLRTKRRLQWKRHPRGMRTSGSQGRLLPAGRLLRGPIECLHLRGPRGNVRRRRHGMRPANVPGLRPHNREPSGWWAAPTLQLLGSEAGMVGGGHYNLTAGTRRGLMPAAQENARAVGNFHFGCTCSAVGNGRAE